MNPNTVQEQPPQTQAPASPPPTTPPYMPPFEDESSKKRLISLIIGIAVVVIVVIVLAVVLVPRLFGPKDDGNATIVYWGLWEDPTVFNTVIADFERQHPNIKVEYQKQDIKSLGNYVNRLQTRINNGTGPDIFRYHNSWITELKPDLLPLPSDLVKSSQLDTQYYDVVKSDLNKNGAYYGIPLGMDALSLFVNTDLFAQGGYKVPKNWDDILNVSRQITVKDQDGNIQTAGVALGTYDNISHASDIISLLLLQNGADIYNLGGDTQSKAESALEYYMFSSQGDNKVWDSTMDASTLAFAEGKLAMMFGYSWDIPLIQAANPGLKFKVVSVPHLLGTNFTLASYWVEGVSRTSKHPQAAFEFLQYLSQKDTLEKLYNAEAQSTGRGFGELYPRKDMANLLKGNQMIYPIVQQFSSAKSTPFASDTYDDGMNKILDEAMSNAINAILTQNTSTETALQTLGQNEAQELTKYGIGQVPTNGQ